jgi:1,4-dihydroxy-2-naphthoyl-CoA hydrolase
VARTTPVVGVAGASATMAAMSDQPTPAPATLSVDEIVARMPEGMGALNEKMGIELTEVSAERIVATMPVEGNTQPYGLLHGGASVVLAESLGSVGSAIAAGPDRIAVGVDISATHHRSARSGTVTGVATPAHLGRSMATWEVVISDEQGRRLCTSRITCALVPAR